MCQRMTRFTRLTRAHPPDPVLSVVPAPGGERRRCSSFSVCTSHETSALLFPCSPHLSARMTHALAMRLLDRYICREVVSHAALGLAVFTFVFFVPQLVRLMDLIVRHSGSFGTV